MKQSSDQFMQNMIDNFEPHEKKTEPDYVKQIEAEVTKQVDQKLREAAKDDPSVRVAEKESTNELPEEEAETLEEEIDEEEKGE